MFHRVECEEIYYNSQTGHVVVSTVGDRDNVSVVDIPIEDVIVTYGAFEGTLTLRCNTDAAPEDYIATIKCDDWKRIITQVPTLLFTVMVMHVVNALHNLMLNLV